MQLAIVMNNLFKLSRILGWDVSSYRSIATNCHKFPFDRHVKSAYSRMHRVHATRATHIRAMNQNLRNDFFIPTPTLVGILSLNSFRNIRPISRARIYGYSILLPHLHTVEKYTRFLPYTDIYHSHLIGEKNLSGRADIAIRRSHSFVLCPLLHWEIIHFKCYARSLNLFVSLSM